MHTQTLSVTLILVTLVIFLTILNHALYRKERTLYLYAASFGCSMVGVSLILFQKQTPIWFGVLLPNFLLMLAFALLSAGIRSYFRMPKIWPGRYQFYLGAFLLYTILFAYVVPFYQLRIIGYSMLVLVLVIDSLICIWGKLADMPVTIRVAVKVLFFIYALFQLLRIIFGILDHTVSNRLILDSAYANGVFLGSILFQISWCSIVLLLDSDQLVRELKRQNQLLESIARTDKLTGLLNRNSFDLEIIDTMELADRHDLPLSFIVLDLDHFKRVNDEFGHLAGDKVLIDLAQLMQESIRGTDHAFRWGGEEFLILLPNTDLSGAIAVAEKIRSRVEQHTFEKVGYLTVSLGVAERFHWESREQWFKRADLCLYRAKAGGRNQVVSWQKSDQFPLSMVKVAWRSEWESGNKEIDEDHRILVEWINQLLDLSVGENGPFGQEVQNRPQQEREPVRVLLERLLQHCQEHFQREEGILEQSRYPEWVEHVKLHRTLLAEALLLRDRYLADEIQPYEFYSFLLGKVIVGHLMTADVKFFPYLKQ